MSENKRKISKILSANDTGETGAHQAGMHVPKEPEILEFFPTLRTTEKNPRFHLQFFDEMGEPWEFAFIYYNNKYFGGTRDEYRLTRMMPFIQMNNLKAGDELILEHHAGRRFIKYHRSGNDSLVKGGVLRLGTKWKVVDI